MFGGFFGTAGAVLAGGGATVGHGYTVAPADTEEGALTVTA